MDFHINEHLPQDFSPISRVWIYQSNRQFLISEALQMEDDLKDFVQQWKSHGEPVKGYVNLFFGRFLVFMADESATTVGGCSTDSSVRFVKELEKKFNTDFFNRLALAFLVKDKVEMVPLNQVNYALENGIIGENTLYFNNTVLTKKELETRWIIPVKESWLAKQLGI